MTSLLPCRKTSFSYEGVFLFSDTVFGRLRRVKGIYMTAVYHQIAHSLRDAIEKKIYRIGDRLPSERELSDTYDVSRMTLRQAISLLVEEGLLERRKGSGTYVASRRVQEKMTGTTSFTDIILKEGKIPSSKLLSYTRTRANKKESEALGIMIGDPVIRMERVRYADRVPVVYELDRKSVV